MRLDIQPTQCREPLPYKELEGKRLPHFLRVMFFDPAPVFERLEEAKIGDVFRRSNSLSMRIIFPKQEGVCSCGCGAALPKGRSRWASDDCEKFAGGVYWIIAGGGSYIQRYVYAYRGHWCGECGVLNDVYEIDHIVPVWAGGGCCWLSNFQVLCRSCHKDKTKRDRQIW